MYKLNMTHLHVFTIKILERNWTTTTIPIINKKIKYQKGSNSRQNDITYSDMFAKFQILDIASSMANKVILSNFSERQKAKIKTKEIRYLLKNKSNKYKMFT